MPHLAFSIAFLMGASQHSVLSTQSFSIYHSIPLFPHPRGEAEGTLTISVAFRKIPLSPPLPKGEADSVPLCQWGKPFDKLPSTGLPSTKLGAGRLSHLILMSPPLTKGD